MSIEKKIVTGVGDATIDAFVKKQGKSLVYTSSEYIHLVASETGSKPYWVIVSEGDDIRAALPLLVKVGRRGPVVNSLAYYGSNGGVVGNLDDHHARVAALEVLGDFCADIGAAASTVITNPLLADHEFYEEHLPHDLRDERIGQFTFFPEDGQAQTLLSMFEDPRPRNIRKAEREGVFVQISQSTEDISFLHATHDQNMRAIGGLPKSLEFFKALRSEFPADSWAIYVARIGEERVAALLLIYGSDTVEYFTPCIVEAYRSSQALALLIYQAMQDAMKRGYKRWNWGGTWLTQGGVYAFKKKWGTDDLPYYYYTRLYSRGLLQATREELLTDYAGFYVLPFNALETTTATKD